MERRSKSKGKGKSATKSKTKTIPVNSTGQLNKSRRKRAINAAPNNIKNIVVVN